MDYKEEYNKKLAELKNTLRSLKENGIDVASVEEEIEKVNYLKELVKNFFLVYKNEIDEAIITLRNSQNKDQKEEVNKILNRVCSLHRLLELDNIIKL